MTAGPASPTAAPVPAPLRNWAGNRVYAARQLHRPGSVEEVQELVARARQVRVLGSGHSFTDLPDAAELVTLAHLPPEVAVDAAAGTVTVMAGLTCTQVIAVLREHGLALHTLASLPHISVAGAVATATHGSGDRTPNLATAVRALEFVTSDGERRILSRGDADLAGAVVHLGALGAVTRLTLDVEPAYDVRQRVFEGLRRPALLERLDELLAAGDSVSIFTRWGEEARVWVKSRAGDEAEVVRDELFGARPATRPHHPVPGQDTAAATAQLGVAGLWADRLPHFRSDHTPSHGAEIQSEYFVDRADGRAALEAVHAIGDRLAPVLLISEIRSVAADGLWLSPHHGRPSLGLHFTWRRDQAAVDAAVAEVEAALAPFAPRPHWGKAFNLRAAELAPRYERLEDFLALRERLDPRGAFTNPWLERTLLDSYSSRPSGSRHPRPPGGSSSAFSGPHEPRS